MARVDLSGLHVGSYLLLNLLGAGSAGSVYRAVDTTRKSPAYFAAKCLPKGKLIPSRGIRLVTEILCHEATNRCRHVLKLRDVIIEDYYILFFFDLCESDLFKAIWTNGVYWTNDDLIRQAFTEIIDGVSACHKMGVYHRDLKPENILCKANGAGIQIGDFGLATHERVCRDGGCGTTKYISPECWIAKKGDAYRTVQNDIWSLGVILFNMVTNRDPWRVADSSDTGFRTFLKDDDYLFHTSVISAELNLLLKRMLHPDPTKRLPIPVIRQAILEMVTFYKWTRSRKVTLSVSTELEDDFDEM